MASLPRPVARTETGRGRFGPVTAVQAAGRRGAAAIQTIGGTAWAGSSSQPLAKIAEGFAVAVPGRMQNVVTGPLESRSLLPVHILF